MSLGFYVALQSSGIVEVNFDPSETPEKALSIIATTKAGTQAGWLTSHDDKIYSVSRTSYPDESDESGGIFAFQRPLGQAGGSLTLLTERSSNGKGGVHCDVNLDGTVLAVANIDGSSASIFPLQKDGTFGEATSIFHYHFKTSDADDFQTVSKPHETRFDPTGRFLFVPARDEDRVYVYFVQSAEKVTHIQDITFPPGTGPRHTIFRRIHDKKTILYLINEKDNTIRSFDLEYGTGDSLQITQKQIISTLGKDLPPSPDEHRDLASEIALTNDGKFAYAANRHTKSMDSDKLAIYSIDEQNYLTYIGYQETLGKIPRHFALSNDAINQWVAIANQLTQEVVVFERDVQSGLLKGLRGRLVLGESDRTMKKGPMCILWK